MKRIGLLLVLAGILAVLLLWLRGSTRAPIPVEGAGARAAPAEDQAPSSSPVAAFQQADPASPTPVPSTTESSRSAQETSEPVLCLLYGVVSPVAGRQRDREPDFVVCISRFGERTLAEAGEDGAYSISGLRSGHYWIQAGDHEGGLARAEIDLRAVESGTRLDLQLEAQPEVWVRVTDLAGGSMSPIGLDATLTARPPAISVGDVYDPRDEAREVGSFTRNGNYGIARSEEWLGRFFVEIDGPVFVNLLRFGTLAASQRVEPGQSVVSFALEARETSVLQGSMRVRLVDAETTKPVDRPRCMLSNRDSVRPLQRVDDTFTATDLWPGRYCLRMSAPGHEMRLTHFRIVAGAETDLGEIALGSGHAISGRIVDETGKGIATGVTFEVCAEDGTPSPRVDGGIEVPSDAEGAFRLPALAPGFYRLSSRAEKEGLPAWMRVIDNRAGAVSDLEIRLGPARPLVVSASDDRWCDVRFRILDSAGSRVVSTRLWSPEPRRILLAAGQYTLEVQAFGPVSARTIPFTLTQEPVEIALP